MVQIEDFQRPDVDHVVRMWRESFEYGLRITDTNPIERQIEYFWKEVAARNRVRVARLDTQIVGFLAANPESVSQLHVRVDYHRRGIGKQLLQLAKAESSGGLWLYTFVRNTNAYAFYESQGFVEAQRGFEPFWQLEDVKFTWSRCDA